MGLHTGIGMAICIPMSTALYMQVKYNPRMYGPRSRRMAFITLAMAGCAYFSTE